MSQFLLHVAGATRMSNTSVIVGDRRALDSLRKAIVDALRSGSGGTNLFSSDGEPHNVAVVFEDTMYPVYTSYAFEPAPERSRRETMQMDQLPNFLNAVANATTWMLGSIDATACTGQIGDEILPLSLK